MTVIDREAEKIIGGWRGAGWNDQPQTLRGRPIALVTEQTQQDSFDRRTLFVVVQPGQTYTLQFAVGNYADGAEGSIETGKVEFSVLGTGAGSTTSDESKSSAVEEEAVGNKAPDNLNHSPEVSAVARVVDALVTVRFSGNDGQASHRSAGMGWIVDKDDNEGYILLPSHLVPELEDETIELRFADGMRCAARRGPTLGHLTLLTSTEVVRVPPVALDARHSLIDGEPVSAILNATDIVRGSIIKAKKTVVLSEFPGGSIQPPLRYPNVIVTDFKSDEATLSGAPLLTQRGEVAGMLINYSEGELFAIPLAEIQVFCRQFDLLAGQHGVAAAGTPLARNSYTAGADYGEFATNLIVTPPSTMPEGHIRSQDLKTNTVTVNLGSAQGVKVGYAYQVFRKTDQGDGVKGVIGAIKITDVQRTTSTAEVLSMQFVDEFQSTDRVRRPMFYSYKSDKVHISVSVTKQFRDQPALLKRAFAPLQALIGSRGLITIGGGDGAHADCRVSIHPPTKYDPEFVQSIADYLKTQNEIAFVEVTIVPHRQSYDDAMSGDPAGGMDRSARSKCEVSRIWSVKPIGESLSLELDFGISQAFVNAKTFLLGVSDRPVLTPDQW